MMKRVALLILAAVVCSSCGSKQPVAVKVMTYNIYSARNAGLEAIAEIIRRNDPDLVSIQEVERNTEINPGDIPARLAEMTGMRYHYFAHALDLEKGDYGNAILSKYPITDGATIKMGTPGVDYIRSFGYVKVEKEGREFYFSTTHLDHRGNDSLRMVQVGEILKIAEGLDAPVILGGDLNAEMGQRPVIALQSFFMSGCPADDCEGTVPVPNPEKAIDYLMYGPQGAFTTLSYKVDYDAGEASDHYPVVAVFRFD